jgi:hypothetical protein
MQTQERRSNSRISLSSKGYAILDSDDIDLTTHNISLGGSLVEFAASHHLLREGMAIRVSLDFGFMGQAVVCHTLTDSTTLYGLKFDHFDHASNFMLGNNILNYKEAAR